MQTRKLALHVRLLQQELNERQTRNPRYSLRAFARVLDMHPSAVSRVLNGKQELSLAASKLILQNLEFSYTQARLFIASVAEDKRNRANLTLSRALEPDYVEITDDDPHDEIIVDPSTEPKAMGVHDVLSLDTDFVSLMNLEGQFLHANEPLAKRLDVIPCELIGERWPAQSFDLETSALLEKQQLQAVEEKRELTFEFPVGRGSHVRILRRTITPILDRKGEMNAYLSTIRDVTWERFLSRAMEQVHSSVDLSRVMAEAVQAPTPIFADGCFLHLSTSNQTAAFHANEKNLGEYRTFIEPWIGELTLETTREIKIHELSGELADSLNFNQERKPRTSIVAPLDIDVNARGSLVFLSQKTYGDHDLIIAKHLARSVSSALRNAITCSA